jgi:hypothetical protein
MSLTVRAGPTAGIWQYNLNDRTNNRTGRGCIADEADHMDVLRTDPPLGRSIRAPPYLSYRTGGLIELGKLRRG